ncbi:hypothetical protein ABEB36_005025 [Hypothenemus hampei]|uniref:Uncharacterized protein n=1 Tax=Hypothenemus hampei TaxID=57062 RepID=A0ABD1EWR4_HYPHA
MHLHPRKTPRNSSVRSNNENKRFDYYLRIDPRVVNYVSACLRDARGETNIVLKAATFKEKWRKERSRPCTQKFGDCTLNSGQSYKRNLMLAVVELCKTFHRHRDR